MIWAFCNILLVCWALKTNNHSSQHITWISELDIKQQGTNSKLQICTFDKPCQSQICIVRKKIVVQLHLLTFTTRISIYRQKLALLDRLC